MSLPKEPRDGGETLADKSWLPRMIDKARLDAEGTINQFDLEYPCPMDQRLLAQLGISGPDFQTIATECTTDTEIVEALKKRNALPV